MATYSSNTTIKIGSSIYQSGFTLSYTVPANCYLKLISIQTPLALFGSNTLTITLPSGNLWINTNAGFGRVYGTDNEPYFPELPAGTVISAFTSGGTPYTIGYLDGILFQNTP